MFRIAPIVLAASLCSVATAQAANLAAEKGATEQQPSTVNANAAAAAAEAQPKPVDKPLPFALAELQLSVNDAGLNALVHGPEAGFVGVLGLSLTWNLTRPNADLPPLLADAVVVAYGFTRTQDLQLKVPFQFRPATAMFIYAQAVVIDARGLCASGVVPLAIEANRSDSGKAADKVPAAN